MNFSHESLKVYQRALDFIEYTNKILPNGNYQINVYHHLDRTSTSISLNIAEGTGKYTGKDKCRFYDIARRSALECTACLDTLFYGNKINKVLNEEGKNLLIEIVAMLIGLIRSSSDRIYEVETEYTV